MGSLADVYTYPCDKCSAGTYKDIIGGQPCSPCPKDTYSRKIGALRTLTAARVLWVGQRVGFPALLALTLAVASDAYHTGPKCHRPLLQTKIQTKMMTARHVRLAVTVALTMTCFCTNCAHSLDFGVAVTIV